MMPEDDKLLKSNGGKAKGRIHKHKNFNRNY